MVVQTKKYPLGNTLQPKKLFSTYVYSNEAVFDIDVCNNDDETISFSVAEEKSDVYRFKVKQKGESFYLKFVSDYADEVKINAFGFEYKPLQVKGFNIKEGV